MEINTKANGKMVTLTAKELSPMDQRRKLQETTTQENGRKDHLPLMELTTTLLQMKIEVIYSSEKSKTENQTAKVIYHTRVETSILVRCVTASQMEKGPSNI